ncbi:MAG: hypothetical protein ACLFTZ_04790 [Acholeplasmataceae bacterium]
MKKMIFLATLILATTTLSRCQFPVDPDAYADSEQRADPILTQTIETKLGTVAVEIDQDQLSVPHDEVTVTALFTAAESFEIDLYTSTFGPGGFISMNLASETDPDAILYSEVYDVMHTDDILELDIDPGDTITRTLKFQGLPYHGGFGDEEPSPSGTYRLEILLHHPESEWIRTDLTV